MSQGQFMALAIPWDEEEVIKVKRRFGSTTWGRDAHRAGHQHPGARRVHAVGGVELRVPHCASRLGPEALVERRAEVKGRYKDLMREIDSRRQEKGKGSPFSGAGDRGGPTQRLWVTGFRARNQCIVKSPVFGVSCMSLVADSPRGCECP